MERWSPRVVTLEAGESCALVYPEHGFQLHRFEVGLADGRRVDVIHGPGAGREPEDRRYGNPVLFPCAGVCNGSQTDAWDFGGRALSMPQHGWARNVYWQVEEATPSSVTGVLVPHIGTRLVFPFDFTFRLRYTIERRALRLDATLVNGGTEPFPYSLGFHPYLRAPAADGGRREDCTTKMPACVSLGSSDGWRTIERSRSPARILRANEPDLADSLVLAETGARSFEILDQAAGVSTTVSVEDSPQSFPVWVIWSPAPDAPYLCIEPWTDAPNALHRPGTRTLAGGATHRYRMTLSARAIERRP